MHLAYCPFSNESLRSPEFPHVVRDALGELGFEDVVAQCMSIHYRLLPVLEKWLGCPVIYTLGWIDDGSKEGMFKFDENYISEKLRDGHNSFSVNIHAWLTLPSMEVVDMSLATSLAVKNKMPESYGAVLAKHADELKGIVYKPMLVGYQFLQRTGLLYTC